MTLDEQIRELVLGAVRDALPELRAELGRSRMIAIKDAIVPYRTILAAEKAGALRVYRIGHTSLVDEGELLEWIRRAGSAPRKVEPDPADEVGALIALGDERRARRTRR